MRFKEIMREQKQRLVERFQHRKHLKTKLSLILVTGAVVFVLMLVGVTKYAETPSFCSSCHIMEPYYNAWSTSKHNFVPCVECHYPPGSLRTLLWKKFQALSQVAKYVTRTYSSKPFAEIEDASCLRDGCHSTRLLEGRVVSKRGVKFDHRPHLLVEKRGNRLRCVSCHSQVVVGNHVEVTYSTCYLCHFRERGEGRKLDPIAGCLGCHELPTQSFTIGNMSYNHKDFVTKRGVPCQNCHLDVVRGAGKAEKERCYTCHNQPEKLERYDDIVFIHENHVAKHNVACFRCHQEMMHGFDKTAEASVIGPVGQPGQQPVGEGHPGTYTPTLTFDCAFCHENKHVGTLEMYSGKVAELNLPEIPSPMYLASVDCVGCHLEDKIAKGGEEFQGKTFVASPQACVKCHGPEFMGIWDETREELNTTLKAIDEKITIVKGKVKLSDPPLEEELWLRDQVTKIAQWQNFVRVSRGEHNIYLASVTLRKADQLLGEVGKKIGVTLSDISALPLLSGGYCVKLCHSKVGGDVPPETVQVFGKAMPHKAHTEMMPCVKCHDFLGHKEASLKKEGKDTICVECHSS